MMRSLYSGVTGLRSHQTKMDVIGNNIANVNTVGFKSSRVVFQDIYSQTLQSASGATSTTDGTTTTATMGGTNPRQIGLGLSMASIDVMHTSAASSYTGAPLDLAIEGDGFFVVKSNGQITYTRAGNFGTDGMQNLCTASGGLVQGYLYKIDLDTGLNEMEDEKPVFENPPDATTGLWTENGTTNELQNIVIPDTYYDVSIGKDGTIVGLRKSDNAKVYIGKIATATFANNTALEKIGGNQYRSTINSGDPQYCTPGQNGGGSLNPGSLEMSNVDLAMEFTELIVTQRGFQANSRTITTSDQMLEELVNLKR